MSDTVQYRITTRRPIGGRMRAVGEIVALTPREAETELPWGGLSPVTAEPVKPDVAEAAEPEPARKAGRKA